jgi:molybdenum cofactor guanylyltransferase
MSCAAVILAGGAGRRLGGVDKPGLDIGGTTLLELVLAAVAQADPVVVVGPEKPITRPVRWARERPPGSGPVAALAAGLTALDPEPELVALFAADLIGLRTDTLPRLIQALEHDGVVLIDETGQPQWLAGVWRCRALIRAMPADPAGRSLRSVLGGLEVDRLRERPEETADVDTPADLAAARRPRRAGGASRPSHW